MISFDNLRELTSRHGLMASTAQEPFDLDVCWCSCGAPVDTIRWYSVSEWIDHLEKVNES